MSNKTIKEIAELVDLSVATLKKYVKLGMPIEADGTFDLSAVAIWVADNAPARKKKRVQAKEREQAIKKAPSKPKPTPPPKQDPWEQPEPESELSMTMTEAKTRSEIAKALLAELTLAKEMEQVANVDDLMGEFSDALVTVRASLSSMSSRLAGILAHQDETQVRKLIEAEVATMLTGLSNYE